MKSIAKLTLLAILLAFALICHIKIGGSEDIGWNQFFYDLFHRGSNTSTNIIVWAIRLPRACNCVVVGGILGLVGCAFQALFRNPLAEPYIVGVSSGAAVGGAIATVTGFGASWSGLAQGFGQTLIAFPAGLISLGLVFAFAQRRGVVQMQTLLLAGVVLGAMMSSILGMVLLFAGQDTNQVLRWLLGSMTPGYWNKIGFMGTFFCLGFGILLWHSKQLNVFALGEDAARRLGVNVKRLKIVVLIIGTTLVAATVGPVGIVGFLGLVAPHISRRFLGVDWRLSLIGSALLGATVLLFSDIVAQHVIPHGEAPVGIVTAIVGAPMLLVLLHRK